MTGWRSFVDPSRRGNGKMEKLAWQLFRSKTPEEIKAEAERKRLEAERKRLEAKRKEEEANLKRAKKFYDSSWGKGQHDKPMADDKDILAVNPGYRNKHFTQSKYQILPDASLDYLKDPGWVWGTVQATGLVPNAGKVRNFGLDPRPTIQYFMDNAPALPSNWGEWESSIKDKLDGKLMKLVPKPPEYVTPITNAMHYAFQPVLTGKVKYVPRTPEATNIVNDIAQRLSYGIRAGMGTPGEQGPASMGGAQ